MSPARHEVFDTHRFNAGDTPQPIVGTTPTGSPVGGETSTSQGFADTHGGSAGGPPPVSTTTPTWPSAGEDFSGQPTENATRKPDPASAEGFGSSHSLGDTQTLSAAAEFLDLRIWAETFNDAQQHRIATVNRMERGGVDADLLAGHREMLDASEHAFGLAMARSYRRLVRAHMPAVEEWQKSDRAKGVGEHSLARLLGHLGHPIHANPYQWMDIAPEGHQCIEERCGKRHLVALEPFERTVGQLWQYCGHGAPWKRKKGMSQDEAFGLGNPTCKMLVHLIAEDCVKAGIRKLPDAPGEFSVETRKPISYFGQVYYDRRVVTLEREWTAGHRQADALRIVGKEILRDLWSNAHRGFDNQGENGAGGPS